MGKIILIGIVICILALLLRIHRVLTDIRKDSAKGKKNLEKDIQEVERRINNKNS